MSITQFNSVLSVKVMKAAWASICLVSLTNVSCVSQQVPVSDHSDGHKFHNLDPSLRAHKSFLEVIKWKMGGKQKAWPSQRVLDDETPHVRNPVRGDDLQVTFINHASVLIQWREWNIITDPFFSDSIGPFWPFKLKRFREPGISFADLPKIHYVMISHNHYDHLDLPSIQMIEDRDHPEYIVPLGMGAYLPKTIGARIKELDWWQSIQQGREDQVSLKITLVPAQHWSKRGVFDTNRSLWSGAVFRAHGRSVFFSGDTGYSNHFKQVFEHLGPMDVALLPIGAYEPRWFMKGSHMNPADSVQAHLDLRSRFSIAIHFGTLHLSDEGIDDPTVDLKAALKDRSVPLSQFVAPRNGHTFLRSRSTDR